jgi:hypothetical protein
MKDVGDENDITFLQLMQEEDGIRKQIERENEERSKQTEEQDKQKDFDGSLFLSCLLSI